MSFQVQEYQKQWKIYETNKDDENAVIGVFPTYEEVKKFLKNRGFKENYTMKDGATFINETITCFCRHHNEYDKTKWYDESWIDIHYDDVKYLDEMFDIYHNDLNNYDVPEEFHSEILDYLIYGHEFKTSFLRAIFTNSNWLYIMNTVSLYYKYEKCNFQALMHIMKYVYSVVPAGCIGQTEYIEWTSGEKKGILNIK